MGYKNYGIFFNLFSKPLSSQCLLSVSVNTFTQWSQAIAGINHQYVPSILLFQITYQLVWHSDIRLIGLSLSRGFSTQG